LFVYKVGLTLKKYVCLGHSDWQTLVIYELQEAKKHLPTSAIKCWWVVWYFVNPLLHLGQLVSRSISGYFAPPAHPADADTDGKMVAWFADLGIQGSE
jgi:hypothetical protein